MARAAATAAEDNVVPSAASACNVFHNRSSLLSNRQPALLKPRLRITCQTRRHRRRSLIRSVLGGSNAKQRMSTFSRYDRSAKPELTDGDEDSDVDLDLQELDPIKSHTFQVTRTSRENGGAGQSSAGNIPLRSLRPGRQKAKHGVSHIAYGDNVRGSLSEDLDSNDRLVSDEHGGDSHPPLSAMDGRKRRKDENGAAPRTGSRRQLSRLISFRRPPSPGAKDDEIEEPNHDPNSTRTVAVGQRQSTRFPPNSVSNAKYTPWSFIPRTLYNEFSFFFNLYFLLVALSQIIPALRIGYLSTYIVPLGFVLAITIGKEAVDDIARRRRDAEANSEKYTVLDFSKSAEGSRRVGSQSKKIALTRLRKNRSRRGSDSRLSQIEQEEEELCPEGYIESPDVQEYTKKSSQLRVGDLLKLGKGHRVPADVVILKIISCEAHVEDMVEDAVATPTAGHGDSGDPGSQGSGLKKAMSGSDDPVLSSPDDVDPSSEDDGAEAFIRTDQLDGETDWKLRLPSPLTQSLAVEDLAGVCVVAGKPNKNVNEFIGTVDLPSVVPDGNLAADRPTFGALPLWKSSPTRLDEQKENPGPSAPLNIDNTAWANTVLASSSTVYAVVVYTGPQTRQALSTSPSRSKTGLLEYEINSLTKILCFLTLALSFVLVALEGFAAKDGRKWYVAVMRFLILFSTIVPISLRVNLDMGKSVYSWFIEHDKGIPGTVVRTSTIPEDLGRIEYLLSDKTGTLTQNDMILRKIHVGTVSYANDAMDEVSSYVHQAFTARDDDASLLSGAHFATSSTYGTRPAAATRTRREIGTRVVDLVLALALCHNVTPTTEELEGRQVTNYQASSPDEIAIVQWAEQVGLRLFHRDRKSMVLQSAQSGKIVLRVHILNVFPFTSESKRMGIIVQFCRDNQSSTDENESGEVWFYEKGADTVMASIVASNDWLEEETGNMAREGLRTLVVGRKKLSSVQYQEFAERYKEASLALQGRDSGMARVIKEHLEEDLELLGVTGVEDKLQRDVKPSLELLRNAGIRIWMLTGDKVETARCVAVSSRLVARGQHIHVMANMKRKDLAADSLSLLRTQSSSALLVDGETLSLLLTHHREHFISTAVLLPAVIACRCSPTQKAEIASLIKNYTKKRVCCIGDGGNDVSMIQAADVGVGVVGKEGRQASLAADFSIDQFCYLTKLLLWHGRNSYKRSAKLAQFVIHRGLIISVCQTVYSIASKFEPVALYKDWLLVGYATLYTMAPVFSLVLDRDVDEHLANLYPELYHELSTSRSLSYHTFFAWVAVSIYQGSIIQGLSQILSSSSWYSSPYSPTSPTSGGAEPAEWSTGMKRMVSLSFTTLIINELAMVAMEITTWHPIMVLSILGTAGVYFGSVPFLERYFDLGYVVTLAFWWRVAAIAAIALVPVGVGRWVRGRVRPESYKKVRGV